MAASQRLPAWRESRPGDRRCSKGVGNTATIGFGWGFLILLALSAIAYWLALAVRLPKEQVEAIIEMTEAEAAEEASELRGPPA